MEKRAYVVLGVVFVGLVVTNHLWLSYDRVPPDWDESVHMMSSLEYHRILSDFAHEPGLRASGVRETVGDLISVDSFVYPPLVTFIGGLLVFAGGGSIHTLAMVNVPFLAILIFSVFQIGKRIGDETTGLLSVVLVLLYPVVFGLTRMPMLDFALLATTALGTYLLLYSDFFTHRGYTISFGISLGLGMLTKPIFMTYMIIPVGYVVGHCVLEAIQGKLTPKVLWRRARWGLGALAVGILIALVWYGPHAHRLGVFRRIAATELWGLTPYDIETTLYYLELLIVRHIGLPFFVLFVYGLCRLKGGASRFHAGLLVLWVVGVYVMLTLVPQKTVRQSVGLLLPISLISAIGLRASGRYSVWVTAAVLIFGFTQFASLSLPAPILADRLGGFRWAGHYCFGRSPENGNWHIEDTVRGMGDEVGKVGVVSDHRYVNGQTVAYFSKAMESPRQVLKCRDHYQDFLDNLSDYDIVITKSDWVPIVHHGNPKVGSDTNAVLLEHFEDNLDRFTLDASRPLPDGSELMVYRQKHSESVARIAIP